MRGLCGLRDYVTWSSRVLLNSREPQFEHHITRDQSLGGGSVSGCAVTQPKCRTERDRHSAGGPSVRISYVELVRETLRRIISLFRCKEFIRHWVRTRKLRLIVVEDIRKVKDAITSLGQINDFSGHCCGFRETGDRSFHVHVDHHCECGLP